MNPARLAVLLGGLIALQGCASMASYEKAKYMELQQELESAGLPNVEHKEPILAGALNLLPGFGNAYLGQWGPFVGNLLFWPLSVAWGVPQAYVDANTINKKETLYFYEFGPGKERLAAAQVERTPAPPPQTEAEAPAEAEAPPATSQP